jgi:hypothetical protein
MSWFQILEAGRTMITTRGAWREDLRLAPRTTTRLSLMANRLGKAVKRLAAIPAAQW